MVTTVANSGRSLLALINDVLDVAKIEAGKSRPEPVDFDVVAELVDSAAMLRPEADRKGLELGLMVSDTVPVRARGDVRQVRQILLNLLANAVKFTDHGRVAIEVTALDTPAGYALTVFVHDTGPGIQSQDRERVFDAFTQSDETAHRRHEGTGLGLAIARQLARGMDGDLRVHATGQTGSTFALELPLSACAELESGDDHEPYPVRVSAPGVQGPDDLYGSLQAAGATLATQGAAGSVVYDLRKLPGDGRIDDPWLDKLARQATQSTPCIVVATEGSLAAQRLAARFPLAVRVTPPPTPAALQRALALVVAGSARTRSGGAGSETTVGGCSQRQANVLLVEDNPVNSMVITKILATAGYTPLAVDSGDAALDQLEAGGIDAVLMDVNMPGESGIETVKLFRFTEMGDRRRVPIIALTADATQETREACLAAGMDEYVTKPVDAGRLLEVLAAHIAAGDEPAAPAAVTDPDGVIDEDAGSREHLDLGALETLIDLDPSGAFLSEVADEFVRDVGVLAADVSVACDHGDVERAGDLLHALKSAAGYAGAASVRDRAVALQAAVTAGRDGDLSAEMAEIRRSADRYRDAVARFEMHPGGSTGVINLTES
jgi:CheY-like chemotaxis protein/anti-sigma regulatory factor (Ser/Thr protein kinase)